jgi:predicted Zn-dependent peptidase
MKKYIIIATSLLLGVTMQAQDRPQPKPGPAPVINLKKPQQFVLANGMKVLVVENHKLPRVSFSLTLDNAPFAEGAKKGVDDLTSALIGNGSKTISKDKFNEEIDFLGANVDFSSNGASASGLSKHAKRILELMADGALHPNFTAEELEKEREKMIEGLKTQEKSVPAVAARVENVLAYGKGHPAGEYLSEETIKNVTLDDVKKNYSTYFVPGNAYLVIVGDVSFKVVKPMVEKLFNGWAKAKAPKIDYTQPKNVEKTQIDFVDMPNAVQSEIAVFNTVNLKMSDPDFYPVILANQVVGGDFNSYLNMNLREAHGWTYGARSSVGFDKYMNSKFAANTQVRNAVTDSAVVEMLKEIKRIRVERVKDEDLNNVKAGYIGRFVMQVEKPATIARYALNIQTQGLPADFYENYIKRINSVTPEDIQRVANKYFLAENLRVLIVGKGSEVVQGLDKLNLPMFFYDKFGQSTKRPAFKRAAPVGVTAKSVVTNYINAVGGEKALKAVHSVSAKYMGTIQETPLEMSMKTTDTHKLAVEMMVMGMSMMKQVVGEKEAYMSQQGQRKNIEGKDLTEMKEAAVPFVELELLNAPELVLDGIEVFNNTECYIVKNNKKTYFYEVATGLKIGSSKESEANGQKMTQTSMFGDYKELNGVKFPYKMTLSFGPQEIEFNASEVKFNEGVTDEDFK